MYPMKFENIYLNKIWGGRDLEKFRDNLPVGDIGESWDLSCHNHGVSIIANGEFQGKLLKDIINEYGIKIVGENINGEFPLLVKIINSRDRLSVQVHPNDDYAKRTENSKGKTEIWYVIDAKKGAKLVVGTKNCDKKIFEKAIKSGRTEEFVNEIDVKKGDCFLINSGLVHAIGSGLTLIEIQQSSDITYRIYDYGRPRELNIDKALDVIDYSLSVFNARENSAEVFDGFTKIILCENKYFTVEKYIIKTKLIQNSDINRFYIVTCVEGCGVIESSGNNNVKITKGDSILIPATLGEYKIKGELEILKSYV